MYTAYHKRLLIRVLCSNCAWGMSSLKTSSCIHCVTKVDQWQKRPILAVKGCWTVEVMCVGLAKNVVSFPALFSQIALVHVVSRRGLQLKLKKKFTNDQKVPQKWSQSIWFKHIYLKGRFSSLESAYTWAAIWLHLDARLLFLMQCASVC